MYLKDYEKWVDKVKKYWQEKIEKSQYVSEKEKLLSSLNKKIQEFINAVKKYKQRFPKYDFKRLILSYFSFYSVGIASKVEGVNTPKIPSIENNIYYYTFKLPENYDDLFKIKQMSYSDENTGSTTTEIVLDTTNFDKLIEKLNSLDDKKNFEKTIEKIANFGSDVAIARMLGGKKTIPNEEAISFEKFCNFKLVCKDFNIDLPGVK